jgi:hypothetical protein
VKSPAAERPGRDSTSQPLKSVKWLGAGRSHGPYRDSALLTPSALREMQHGLRAQGEPRRQAVPKTQPIGARKPGDVLSIMPRDAASNDSVLDVNRKSSLPCEESQLMEDTRRMSMMGPTLAKTKP